ncbi:MAG TPA: endolytic transglycosylase MltG, partial [Sinomonas sp.]|nr:endolytic transglycosylase MltG [Sinomonas sp.]
MTTSTRRHHRHRPLRHAAIAMGVAITLVIGASIVAALGLRSALGMDKIRDYPGPGSGEVVVTVQQGAGVLTIAQELQNDGVVADADTFVRAFGDAGGKIHPGDFTFKKQMNSSDAAQVLAGDSAKVMYFALSAGLRVNESLDIIAKSAGVDRKDLDKLNAQPGQFGL